MRTKNFIFLLALVILFSLLLIILGPGNSSNITNIQNIANQQLKFVKVSFLDGELKFFLFTQKLRRNFAGKSSCGEGERARCGSAAAEFAGIFSRYYDNARQRFPQLQHNKAELLSRELCASWTARRVDSPPPERRQCHVAIRESRHLRSGSFRNGSPDAVNIL